MPDLSIATLVEIGEELQRRDLMFVLLAESRAVVQDTTQEKLGVECCSAELERDGLRLLQFLLDAAASNVCNLPGRKVVEEE